MSGESLIRHGTLIRQLQGGLNGALGGNKVVRGVINTTGPSITEGEGFSIAKNGTGDVTITFDPAFSDRPAVAVTPVSSSVRIAQQIAAATASTARVGVFTSAFAAVDATFDFVAVGPA